MSGYWPYPHPRQSEHHHLRADQHPAQRSRYDGHQQQQSMPVVHYNNGLADVHMWWMVFTQQQQQTRFHPPHQMGYHHGLPAPPYPMLSVPSSRWPLPDPCMYARRPGYGDDDARRRRDRHLATAATPPLNDPISPSPLRLPPTQAAVVRGPKQEGGTPRGSSPRPTPADRQTMGNGRRPASPRRRIRTPKSCPVARVEPPESSARPGLPQHPSCWTVGRSSRPPIDESETLTNSMHKRRRVSRTEYLRLPVFSEDERDDAAKGGGQQQLARKGLSFTDMLIEHRRKSAASSFFTPERSEARRKDNKLQASASRTPAPTRRLSVIEEAAEASARHTPEKQRGVGSPTPRGLRTQLSSPLTDPRSWYDGERTPSSPSLPRINPADYGCGVPEDDTGFTTDVERGIAGEEDIGNSSSDEDDEEEETSERSDEESSGGEGSTSEFEIVQRGDEIVRRKRRKKKERAKDLDFIDRSEEFNTGLFATADEPTLRFKKVVTRRFGAKLRGHPMFREDVQRQEQENGEHVVEYQM